MDWIVTAVVIIGIVVWVGCVAFFMLMAFSLGISVLVKIEYVDYLHEYKEWTIYCLDGRVTHKKYGPANVFETGMKDWFRRKGEARIGGPDKILADGSKTFITEYGHEWMRTL